MADGAQVVDEVIAKLQTKIDELKNQTVSLSPEVVEAAYEATVTDFGLGLEEERLLSTDIIG
jgi:FtsZ-binding cell division protein ZapB